MAVMWPRRLPPEITSNLLRGAECKVYQQLYKVLDNSFVVFYSRPWLGLTPYGEEKDGECDFLIAHQDLGVLAIEVKGGAVSYDPEEERWTTRDRWGFVHKIKNPILQAVSSKHQIVNKLNNSSVWKSHFIRARHGVIFPDSEKPEKDLGANIPLYICCFLDEFENDLRGWVLNRFSEADRNSFYERPLGKDGIEALEELLAHPFMLHVPIGRTLADDDTRIETLTHQQFHILEAIRDIPRVVISGGAGTGKTILAMEEAIRCSNADMHVLLTCYNRPLAEEIRRRLQPWKKVTVTTFHELCSKLAKNAEIQIPEEKNQSQLFREMYPEILLNALKSLTEFRFDAIIVDEGQDFLSNWISVLGAALNPNGDGIFRIFVDSNQSIYDNISIIPKEFHFVPIRLTTNMRNTRRIHSAVQEYYKGYTINALGPEGVEVEWIAASSLQDTYMKIGDKLRQLVSQERVSPSDIAVLMEKEQYIKECAPGYLLGGQECQRADETEENSVIIETVRRFKGLESRIVILAVTSGIIGNRELAYVALSRARTLLIVVGDIIGLKQSAIQE